MITPRWVLSIVALYAVAGLVLVRCAPARHQQIDAPAPQPFEREGALSDQATPGASGGDVPIPPKEKVEKWQKTTNCDPDMDEHFLNGACYARMSRKPPCGPKLRRHGDACYRFVDKPERPPSSVGR
jgi:hypothetical protein